MNKSICQLLLIALKFVIIKCTTTSNSSSIYLSTPNNIITSLNTTIINPPIEILTDIFNSIVIDTNLTNSITVYSNTDATTITAFSNTSFSNSSNIHINTTTTYPFFTSSKISEGIISQNSSTISQYKNFTSYISNSDSPNQLPSTMKSSPNEDKIEICYENVIQNHLYEASDTDYKAQLAIDNNLETCSFTAQANLSKRNILGWWKADLGSLYEITYIKILDSISQYPGYFEIYLSKQNKDTALINNADLCIRFDSSLYNQEDYNTFFCETPIIGQYLVIKKIEGGKRQDALALCELQVFGRLYQVINLDKKIDSLKNKEIIIGVIVGIISAFIGIIIGLIIGYFIFMKKDKIKRNQSENSIDEYLKTCDLQDPDIITMNNEQAGESHL